ncbi:hypothetical protein CD351_07300 [Erythrobacter sp. KY5]|uniref:hypothetical protein n=1 Tax=Erythrobacter sp. KY5 TaxID=2011159 RepID=UPI000DBF30E6|nr:hypothetical protein [Erythrobacter sp. KY5]AWW74234.1 hypothetical protein CD351_07300 [Erythrobacter sp. KY5]
MEIRASRSTCLAIALALLAGCGEEATEMPSEILTQDPQLARALNDPLMIDPDLAWRSEANAVIAYRDGHPLPLIEAREDSAARAREEARLELLENGQIPAPSPAISQASDATFADLVTADQMVEAAGARTDCIARMNSDLEWSTRMPATSSIMPHGMVQQAAGVDEGTCVVRVVRYLTPVGIEDALEYHWAKVERARFDLTRYARPAAQLHGERRDQKVIFEFREGPGGMTAVDVVHWRK